MSNFIVKVLIFSLVVIGIALLGVAFASYSDSFDEPITVPINNLKTINWKKYKIPSYDIEFKMPGDWNFQGAEDQECPEYMAVSGDGTLVIYFIPPCMMAESIPEDCPPDLLIFETLKDDLFLGRYKNVSGRYEYMEVSTTAWKNASSIHPNSQNPDPWCYWGSVRAGNTLFDISMKYFGDEEKRASKLELADQIVSSFVQD